MKKLIFKVLTYALMLAMVVTAVVIPNETAKAAEKETELVFITSAGVDNVLVATEQDSSSPALSFAEPVDTTLSWSGWTFYPMTKDDDAGTIWKITVTGNFENGYCNMQFVVMDGSNAKCGYKYFPQDNRALFTANDTLYLQGSLSDTSWPTIYASKDDPNAITAQEVIALIDAIGTVELTAACREKVTAAENAYASFKGDKAEITNYATLEAAVAAFTTDAAGEVKIYVTGANNATSFNLYGWEGVSTVVNNWDNAPAMTEDENNDGWYTYTDTVTKAANYLFKVGSEQSTDWTFVAAGTYWVTLSEKNSEGKWIVDAANISTTAPEGWSTGNEGGSGSVDTYKINVQIPEDWTNPKYYVWDANGTYQAAWPGTALGTAVDGWYTIEVPVTMVNLIINADGNVQTGNIENIDASKEQVWVTVTGTGNDGFKVAYTAPVTGDVSMALPLVLVLFGGAVVILASKKRFA